jgi:hypothetical protein
LRRHATCLATSHIDAGPAKIFSMKLSLAGVFLVVSCLAAHAVPNVGTASEAPFEMNGTVLSAPAIVSLKSNKTGQSGWYSKGQKIDGYTIKDFSAKSVLLELDNGQNLEVFLAGSSVTPGEAEGNHVPRYSKAWINSKENPMLTMIIPLPSHVLARWGSMSTEEKSEIIEYYKKHGWQLRTAQSIGGAGDFVWDNIYEAERIAIIRDRVKAFKSSLSAQQLEMWQRVNSSKPVPFSAGRPTSRDREILEKNNRDRDAFIASLSQSQKSTFDTMGDFTSADWTK